MRSEDEHEERHRTRQRRDYDDSPDIERQTRLKDSARHVAVASVERRRPPRSHDRDDRFMPTHRNGRKRSSRSLSPDRDDTRLRKRRPLSSDEEDGRRPYRKYRSSGDDNRSRRLRSPDDSDDGSKYRWRKEYDPDSAEERRRTRYRRRHLSTDRGSDMAGERRRDRSRRRESSRDRDSDSLPGRQRDRYRHRDRSQDGNYDRDQGRRRRSRSPPRKPRSRSSSSPPRRSRQSLPSQVDSFHALTRTGLTPPRNDKPVPKEKPNYNPTGLLARETNLVAGTDIVLKYNEPAEARKPAAAQAWRLFVFKGADVLETVELGARSVWLLGRETKVVDVVAAHPSISGQHAVVQFRHTTKTGKGGEARAGVRPYLLDLESANGTWLNGNKVEGRRYVELRSGDLIKLGSSEREYVIMLPPKES